MKKNKLLIQLFALVFLLCFNTACIPFGYYHRLATHQTYILRSKVPIAEVLKDESINPETKAKLRIVLEVRDFASKQLGLEVGSNYLDYVPLKESSVSYVVNAAEPYSLNHYYWSYPVVGKLPYRGYPSKKEADDEATKMQTAGYDAYVRGVSAYSTLGWFNDPVFSSMLSLPEERLVETIIHESVHATIFYKDDADFNERLATFLGAEGAKLFYNSKGNRKMVESIIASKQKQFEFASFMNMEIKILQIWYKDVISKIIDPIQKQKAKQDRLNIISKKMLELGYAKATDDLHFNNARLMLFSTYNGNPEEFRKLYSHFSDFKTLIRVLKSYSRSKDLPLR